MLKIAKAQAPEYMRLVQRLLDLHEENSSPATLELLVKQSLMKTPVIQGYLACESRDARFHIDRRMALYDWLLHSEDWYADVDDMGTNLDRFHVSVMAWGDTFLYSYKPSQCATETYRLEDMIGDLSWYHTAHLVPYISSTKGKHTVQSQLTSEG